MKKVLVPIDLTKASVNAIVYIASLGIQSDVEEIFLLGNSHHSLIEQLYPSPDYLPASAESEAELEAALQEKYQEIRSLLSPQLSHGMKLNFKVSRSPLLTAITDALSGESPDLLVLGSDLDQGYAKGLIGNNLIDIAKMSTIPVLIVPESATYQPILNALLPYNSSNALRLDLVTLTPIFRNYPKPKLLLLNVKDNDLQPESSAGKSFLEMIGDYPYDFFSGNGEEIFLNITEFTREHEVQLIIALPGNHGAFYKLIHRSVTAVIAKNEQLPVLILRPQQLKGEDNGG